MPFTAPDGTPFRGTRPSGLGGWIQHVKQTWGAGEDSTGVGTEVADTDAARLPVGGASIGNPGDTTAANSLIGLIKRLLGRWPAALTAGGHIPVEIMIDNSGVPTGQALMAASVPVVIASNQIVDPYLVVNTVDLDETDEDIKASPGRLYGFDLHNNDTAAAFVRFYNTTTPTVGTTVAVCGPYGIPGGALISLRFPAGIAFTTAISWAATSGNQASSTGAPAANSVTGTALYQ